MLLKKRFIAGATCPKCGQLDKIAVYKTQDDEFAECVRCGHKMTRPKESTNSRSFIKKKIIPLKVEKD